MQSQPQSPQKSTNLFSAFSKFIKKEQPTPRALATDFVPSSKHFEINKQDEISENIFDVGEDLKTQTTTNTISSPAKMPQQTVANTTPVMNFDGITKMVVVKKLALAQNKTDEMEPYSKGQTIQYPPQSAFKVVKIPKAFSSFIDFLKGQVDRYVIIDAGWIYIVQKLKVDNFKVCSVSSVKNLKTILLSVKEGKNFFLIDFTDGKSKTYHFHKTELWNLFLIKLKAEVQRFGSDII